MQLYHLIIYVPVQHASAVRTALAEAGAGQIGHYDSCSFSTKGIGRFWPQEGAHPTEGSIGKLEEVEEERIEVVVTEDHLQQVLNSVKEVHPYEEPAMHLLRMEDYKEYL